MINNSRSSVTVEGRAQQSSTLTIERNTEQVRPLILNSWQLIINELENQLQVSHGSVFEIIHHRLRFRNVCTRLVPKQFMEQHRRNRLQICGRLIKRYYEKRDAF
jgi:hypothetical protein